MVNGTVKENIVFGLKFDQAKYDDVIKRACLEDDFEMLPGGDLT